MKFVYVFVELGPLVFGEDSRELLEIRVGCRVKRYVGCYGNRRYDKCNGISNMI